MSHVDHVTEISLVDHVAEMPRVDHVVEMSLVDQTFFPGRPVDHGDRDPSSERKFFNLQNRGRNFNFE